MTHRDGLPRFSARSAPGGRGGCPPGYINAGGAPRDPRGWRCGASQSVRDAVRKPW